MTLIESLRSLEAKLAEENLPADIGDLWPGDALHKSPPFGAAELARIRAECGIKLPPDYIDFASRWGAIGFGPKDEDFARCKIRMMLPSEIIQTTKFWREELDFAEYGFGPLASWRMQRFMNNACFFQFVTRENHSRYYALHSAGKVREWDEDDLGSFQGVRAASFTSHLTRLVADLRAQILEAQA